jgi:hypothetical protein
VRIASIVRAMKAFKAFIVLKMEAVRTSETSVHFNVLHGAAFQKILNFILSAVRT